MAAARYSFLSSVSPELGTAAMLQAHRLAARTAAALDGRPAVERSTAIGSTVKLAVMLSSRHTATGALALATLPVMRVAMMRATVTAQALVQRAASAAAATEAAWAAAVPLTDQKEILSVTPRLRPATGRAPGMAEIARVVPEQLDLCW